VTADRPSGAAARSGDPAGAVARLRPATIGDTTAMAGLFIDAWRRCYAGIVAAEVLDRLDRQQVTGWLARLVGEPGRGHTDLAVAGDRIAGFVRYGIDAEQPDSGQVYGLYVHPDTAGRGIGRQLLDHATGWLAGQGCRHVSLYVFERNARARRLYERAGFRPGGGRRVEEQYGAPEIRMILTFPPADP
jgi:ribosomal protein S18 acetylase RimI-like enzyme